MGFFGVFLAPAFGFLADPAAFGFLAAAFFLGEAFGLGEGDLLAGDPGAAAAAAEVAPDSSFTGDRDGAARLEAFLGLAFLAAGFRAPAFLAPAAALGFLAAAFLGEALFADGDLAFFGPFAAFGFLAAAFLGLLAGEGPEGLSPPAAGAGLLGALGFAAFFGEADRARAGDLAFPAAFAFDGARGFRAAVEDGGAIVKIGMNLGNSVDGNQRI